MADIKVQRGYADIPNTGGVITLPTPVSSTSSAFAINTNNRRMHGGRSDLSAVNMDADDMSGGVYLSNTSTVQFDRISTSAAVDMRFFYEVWEYTGQAGGLNEFIVRGTYQLSLNAVESVTQAVPNISNIDKCIPYITGILCDSSADDADSTTAIAWMSGTGTLNVKRGSGANNNVQVYVTVVEFTGANWSVKHGRKEGDGTDSGTITLVDNADGITAGGGDVTNWDNALIIHQYKANALNGVDDAISDTSAVYVPGATTTEVDYIFHSDHVDSAAAGQREEFMIHVLCNPSMRIKRMTDYQNAAGTMEVSAKRFYVTMETSAVEVSRYSSGNGTAYGRGWVNAMVNSVDVVELWVHRSGNTIRTEVQEIDLTNVTNIAITSQGDKQLDYTDTGEIATGFGFGATQGTGELVLGDSPSYSSANKVVQVVNSWSDTEINFDPVFTGFTNGFLYLFVKNDNGDISPGFKVNFGEMNYIEYFFSKSPDIYHTFDNTYLDEMGIADANSLGTTGVVGFEPTSISRDTSYAFRIEDKDSRIEMKDTIYTNSLARTERTVGGWIQFDRIHLTPSGIYEEGGGVNNLYFVVGFGNIVLGNIADSNGNPDYKIQGFSDTKLSVNRPYHIILKVKVSSAVGADDGRFQMYVDGKEVSKYAGLEAIPNLIKDIEFSSHGSDWSYGKPDSNLDTGGTDIAYPGAPFTLISNFGTWSDLGYGALSDQEIFELFIRGAKQTTSIVTDTQANMQIAIDALEGTIYNDKPLPIKIYNTTDVRNPTFNLRNITFDERCSSQVVWMGPGNLTLIAWSGTNLDINECHSLNQSGTINIIYPNKVTVTGVVDGSKIVIYEHTSGNLIGSVESSNGDFSVETLENSVDIFIIADGWKIIQRYDVPITLNSLIPIVQERDYTYDNPS